MIQTVNSSWARIKQLFIVAIKGMYEKFGLCIGFYDNYINTIMVTFSKLISKSIDKLLGEPVNMLVWYNTFPSIVEWILLCVHFYLIIIFTKNILK